MLKRRTFLSIGIALGSVLMLPLMNVLGSMQAGRAVSWSAGPLFSTDVPATSWMNLGLYRMGISTSPNNVVVGRDGWLFLGDAFAETLTATRRGQMPADVEQTGKINAAVTAWDDWMQQRGVKLFRVLLAPNKSSIHADQLPYWAKPASTRPVDGLLARGPHFVDPTAAMLQARSGGQGPLYFRTDTHWTPLGAAIAFQSLQHAVTPHAPDLRWPDHGMLRKVGAHLRKGGDLARFLRLTDQLPELEPTIGLARMSIETVQYDHASDQVLRSGGNPTVRSPPRPLRVVSPKALNARKVLWVRDSFGTALSPIMAATFTEVVQVYWSTALQPPTTLAGLVDAWRPDYVFVTVVERDALHPLFAVPPPGPLPSQETQRGP